MPTVILLPNAVAGGSPGLTAAAWSGGAPASVQAALSDHGPSSDYSYVQESYGQSSTFSDLTAGITTRVLFTTTTLPAGAVIKKVTPYMRAFTAFSSSSSGSGAPLLDGGGFPQMYTIPTYAKVYMRVADADTTLLDSDSPGVFTQPLGLVNLENARFIQYAYSEGDPMTETWTVKGVPTGSSIGKALTAQQIVDTLALGWRWNLDPDYAAAPIGAFVVAVWLEVEYVSAPVASALTLVPLDAASRTTRPGISWTYTDSDGGPQSKYDVFLWSSADYLDANFSPFATSFVASNGTTRTPRAYVQGTGAATSWIADQDIVDGTTYRFHVRVGKAMDSETVWSATATSSFVAALLPPPAPVTPVVTREAANFRTKIDLAFLNNMLSTDAGSFEVSTGGWTGAGNATVARTTAQFSSGSASLGVTSIAAGDMNAWLPAPYNVPVVVGKTYTALASFRAATVGRQTLVGISWRNAADVEISVSTGTSSADTTGTFGQRTVTGVAPANAVKANIFVRVVGTAGAGELHYVDKASLAPGSSTTWTRGGLMYNPGKAYVERSSDGGTTWQTVYLAAAANGASGPYLPIYTSSFNQEFTGYDVSAAPNVSYIYRTRGIYVDDGGYPSTSPYSANSSSVAATQTSWLLRDPTNESAHLVLRITGDLDSVAEEANGVFRPLGRSRHVVVSDASLGEQFDLPIQVRGVTERQSVETLRATSRSRPLLLQSDMGDQWWVKVTGPRKRTLLNNITRKTTPVYNITLPLVEVDPIAGSSV